ncbi:hypothetical protein [Bradyrhizobium betae]|uniref:Uncharacterized protein n=1 Tax=Bradyrhizobium betae TaxID=244734 RepID=A0A5P6PB52_9BRAD|nr:hypothetical protein [Bradyrhizobium betae]MCS3726483.1 hypothetical protein [Bradyrhizobium betae]QFI75516.1 hypothetical protein F8237_25850 [Bradyrhizobium betae]
MFQVKNAVFRSLTGLLSFCTFTLLLFGPSGAQENLFDKEAFHRAADYCRSVVVRPIALSEDQAILCLDGRIEKNAYVSPAKKLKEGGLFVVRSAGGDIASAIALAEVLRERRAVVVVYDHCLSSCANYLLIASDQAHVLKGALVAWDYESSDPALPSCAKFAMEKTRDGDYRLQRGSCQPSAADEAQWRDILLAQTAFYRERMVDPYFEPPPDNRYLRKVVKSLNPDTHAYHYIGWTLHPRYFARLFKTTIVYESYPNEQAEVDEMVARLHLDMRVIFDP